MPPTESLIDQEIGKIIDQAVKYREAKTDLHQATRILTELVFGTGPLPLPDQHRHLNARLHELGPNLLRAMGELLVCYKHDFQKGGINLSEYQSAVQRVAHAGLKLTEFPDGRARIKMRGHAAVFHYRLANVLTEDITLGKQFAMGLAEYRAALAKTDPRESSWPEYMGAYGLALARRFEQAGRAMISTAIRRHERNEPLFRNSQKFWHWVIIQCGLLLKKAEAAHGFGDFGERDMTLKNAGKHAKWLKRKGYPLRYEEWTEIQLRLGRR